MGLVDTCIYQIETTSELLEVSLLRRAHRMCCKEGDDHVDQIFSTTYRVAVHVLLVVVISFINVDISHTEELHELVKTRHTLCALTYREVMGHLIAGFVAFTVRPIWLSNETNGEASLSVYKTNNPTKLNQPFLLVFCTRHIVTVARRSDRTSRYE